MPKINEKELIEMKTMGIPTTCPECGADVHREGVDLVCGLKGECPQAKLLKVNAFIVNNEIEGASDVSLKNWGITDFAKLFAFNPSVGSKSQMKFHTQFLEKVFTKSREELITMFSCEGMGKTTMNKLLKIYAYDELIPSFRQNCFVRGLPSSVGDKTIKKSRVAFLENVNLVETVIRDPRYNLTEKVESANEASSNKLSGKKFCVTGTLSVPRKEIEKLITDNGGVVSGLRKSTNYLIAGEKAGSKLSKAKKFGTLILNETQLREMI